MSPQRMHTPETGSVAGRTLTTCGDPARTRTDKEAA